MGCSRTKSVSSGVRANMFEPTSKMITVSAVSKLIPRPPARVDNKNAKSGDPGALKCSMDFFRTSEGTVPGHQC